MKKEVIQHPILTEQYPIKPPKLLESALNNICQIVPLPYTVEELGKVYEVFDWLADAIVYGRPIGAVLFFKTLFIPHEQKDFLVELLSPVIRILFMANRNIAQVQEILDGPYADLVEICIIDRDRMRLIQNCFIFLRHKVPLLLLETKEAPEDHTVISGLKEERVLATIWNFIQKKVVAGYPRVVLIPKYDPREVDFPNTLDPETHFLEEGGQGTEERSTSNLIQ